MTRLIQGMALLAPCLALSACTNMHLGRDAARNADGQAVAGSKAVNPSKYLQRCDRPLGTLAFYEPPETSEVDLGSEKRAQELYQANVDYAAPLLKQTLQASNCFVIVERGTAFAGIERERDLHRRGELRDDTMGPGQLVAADYTLDPRITYEAKGSGAAVTIGALLDLALLAKAINSDSDALDEPYATEVGASVRIRNATTLLTLIDNRTGVQLAASTGRAKNVVVSPALLFGTDGVSSGLKGYVNTREGKVVMAAFLDAQNGLIAALREGNPPAD